VISWVKTDLITLVTFWTCPSSRFIKHVPKTGLVPIFRLKLQRGSYSAHSIMNLMSTVHLKVERETIAEFLCLRVEDVKVPKGIQVNYEIPLSELSEVFVEKY
jgi:hypothetical protein